MAAHEPLIAGISIDSIRAMTEISRRMRERFMDLPAGHPDRACCMFVVTSMASILDVLDGQVRIAGMDLDSMPEQLATRVMDLCAGQGVAARKYIVEATRLALRIGFEPHDFGIGLGDAAAGSE